MKNTFKVIVTNENGDTELKLRKTYHLKMKELPEVIGFLSLKGTKINHQ